MNKIGNLFRSRLELNQIKEFSVLTFLRQRHRLDVYNTDNVQSSLWFTSLPSRKKRALGLIDKKRPKLKKFRLPAGPLVIDCKRPEFNHHKGVHYSNFDVIPLASKAWHHRKSRGDYFTILPTTEHPAFLLTTAENLPETFEQTNLSDEVIKQLQKLETIYPTTIQAKAIPIILQGKSVLIAAETGCGKTLAYLAPILENILRLKKKLPSNLNAPFAVILLPTRELAIQVGMVANQMCSNLDIKCLTLLGGKTKKMLLNPTSEVTDILVCTLGVFSKMLTFGIYSMHNCKHLVLDEADTLLDDSFNEKLKYIFRKSKIKFGHVNPKTIENENSQLYLVSATLPRSLDSILENVITRENLIEISTNHLHKIQSHVPQKFIRLAKSKKPEELLKLIKHNVREMIPTMIFSNKTATCNWLNHFLTENGIKSIRINADMEHENRLEQYQQFREGNVNVICCTDIASRGLDCTRVKHVINYEFPRFIADYIHRCGRTGRIGHDANCLISNFVSSPKELPLVHSIEKSVRTSLALENVNNNIARILKYKTMKTN